MIEAAVERAKTQARVVDSFSRNDIDHTAVRVCVAYRLCFEIIALTGETDLLQRKKCCCVFVDHRTLKNTG